PDVRPQPYFALLFDRAATAVVATLSLHDALPIWPLGGIDQHDDAIHHRQNALDLAAEIGVTGGIDDVDTGLAPLHRGAFGEDGDTALALDVAGIHGAFGDLLVVAEGAGLLQKLVDQRGLAVVDVGDDGDVAKAH